VRRLLVTLGLLLALAAGGSGPAPGARLSARGCPPLPPPQRVHRITRPRWLPGTIVTEYWPAPERWFAGKLVPAPGLAGRHRVDWLYGAHGLPMEGEGVGRDGLLYHFAGPYDLSWVNRSGRTTLPCWNGSWTNGSPAWLDLGWRTIHGTVTFPLARGGWSSGRPGRLVRPPAVPRFAPGRSRTLTYWKSVAVDPQLIPLGSRIFVAAYCSTPAHGWLVAADTGGAIIARHLDVYRPPPASTSDGRMLRGQRVFVVPPGFPMPKRPRCSVGKG
jgi:hypothetical protein